MIKFQAVNDVIILIKDKEEGILLNVHPKNVYERVETWGQDRFL